MEDMGDVVLAFGESDEYRSVQSTSLKCQACLLILVKCSFLIRRASQVYNRRRRWVTVGTIVSGLRVLLRIRLDTQGNTC